MNLELNYYLSLVEMLHPRGDYSRKKRVELAFYRSVIYSKIYNAHDKAHDELHFLVENRDALDSKITRT
jgi:hypothetical protein